MTREPFYVPLQKKLLARILRSGTQYKTYAWDVYDGDIYYVPDNKTATVAYIIPNHLWCIDMSNPFKVIDKSQGMRKAIVNLVNHEYTKEHYSIYNDYFREVRARGEQESIHIFYYRKKDGTLYAFDADLLETFGDWYYLEVGASPRDTACVYHEELGCIGVIAPYHLSDYWKEFLD